MWSEILQRQFEDAWVKLDDQARVDDKPYMTKACGCELLDVA